MPCTPPITNSPGHLFWKYSHHTDIQHTCSARFIAGVDITDTPNLRTEAQRIASEMRGMLVPSFTIYAWGIRRADGSLYYVESFTTPYVGGKVPITGLTDYRSTTIQFNGHGNPGGAGDCAGPEHTVFYFGNGYEIQAGMKSFDGSALSEVAALLLAFNTSTYLPADKWGQQVTYLPSCPIQYNAHTQKVHGA